MEAGVMFDLIKCFYFGPIMSWRYRRDADPCHEDELNFEQYGLQLVGQLVAVRGKNITHYSDRNSMVAQSLPKPLEAVAICKGICESLKL